MTNGLRQADNQELLRRARSRLAGRWVADAVRLIDNDMAGDGAHDAGHLARVLTNAGRIVDGERTAARLPADFSWEAVGAAALLHDCVNLPKDHPERHLASARSAERAVGLLRGCTDFPAAALDKVAEAIRCHSYSAGHRPESVEAQVLSDADRLEAIGAVGVARTFWVCGRLEGRLFDLKDPFAQDRALDDRRNAVDHFFKKLLHVRSTLFTETGRQIGEQRHAYLLGFVEQLGREVNESP